MVLLEMVVVVGIFSIIKLRVVLNAIRSCYNIFSFYRLERGFRLKVIFYSKVGI